MARSRRVPTFVAALVAAVVMSACGVTTIQGARSLHEGAEADLPNTWIYLQTNDTRVDGVYRCYDNNGAPVCKKAKLTN